jgi:hypothetical protein
MTRSLRSSLPALAFTLACTFAFPCAGQDQRKARWKLKALLTENELEFLMPLEVAAPELCFLPAGVNGRSRSSERMGRRCLINTPKPTTRQSRIYPIHRPQVLDR